VHDSTHHRRTRAADAAMTRQVRIAHLARHNPTSCEALLLASTTVANTSRWTRTSRHTAGQAKGICSAACSAEGWARCPQRDSPARSSVYRSRAAASQAWARSTSRAGSVRGSVPGRTSAMNPEPPRRFGSTRRQSTGRQLVDSGHGVRDWRDRGQSGLEHRRRGEAVPGHREQQMRRCPALVPNGRTTNAGVLAIARPPSGEAPGSARRSRRRRPARAARGTHPRPAPARRSPPSGPPTSRVGRAPQGRRVASAETADSYKTSAAACASMAA